jgi:hypothetical protein
MMKRRVLRAFWLGHLPRGECAVCAIELGGENRPFLCDIRKHCRQFRRGCRRRQFGATLRSFPTVCRIGWHDRPPLSETGLAFVRQAFSDAGQTRWFAHRRGFPLAYKPRLGGIVPKARHSANAAHISPITAAMPIHGSKYLMRLGLFGSFCILILILDERY